MNKNDRKSDEICYTRSVFFVADVEKALHHYQGLLGFERAWDHQDDAKTTVAQVTRSSGCEIILCETRLAQACHGFSFHLKRRSWSHCARKLRRRTLQ